MWSSRSARRRVDRLEAGNSRYVNRLRMYYSYDEFVSEMGWDEENFNKYSLQELAYSHFALYRGAPAGGVQRLRSRRPQNERQQRGP